MEAQMLAGVIQTDIHKRMQVAEQLIEYFRKEDCDFSELDDLVARLASWMSSSSFKVLE